jgi:hypothetical protein
LPRHPDEQDLELLVLAEATERVAETTTDRLIAARLHTIASEVRSMARCGGDPPVMCCLRV